ncbi:rab guanine nucleotide exchange factor S2 [Dinochytrium kinnereticum]|nr:rab guanine nucleotide exchange factor S2 [Dinochytrium kinnereticum]
MTSLEGVGGEPTALDALNDKAENLYGELSNDIGNDGNRAVIEALERENAELKASLNSYRDQVEKQAVQLKESADKHAKDKANAHEDLHKKNGIIDRMRVKLNRCEFAIKEAILFLSKPMEGYEAWLNSRSDSISNGSQAMLAAAVAGAINAAQGSSGHGTNAPPSPSPSRVYQEPGRSRSPSTAPKPSSWSSLAPSLSKDNRTSSQAALSSAATHGSATPSNEAKPPGATNLEIQCLECMRLALNYLKNAQSSVQAMGRDGSEISSGSLAPPSRLIAEGSRILSETLLEVDEEERPSDNKIQGALTVALHDLEKKVTAAEGKKIPSPKGTSPEIALPKSPLAVSAGSQTSQTALVPPREASGGAAGRSKSPQRSPLSLERNASSSLTNQALIHAAEALPEEEDGDITGMKSSSYPSGGGSGAANKKCTNCRDLRLQIEHHVDTINQLRDNVTALANELEEEKATIERIQLSKDILDQELEELTAQLFDQANRMVIDEARMREELENTNRDLRGELKELLQKSEGREDELKELRRNLRALEAAKNRSANASSPYASINNLSITTPKDSTQNLNAAGPTLPRGSSSHQFYAVTSLCPPRPSTYASVPVDGQLLSEFQDHIKQIMLASSLPQAQALQVTLGTSFMKRCLTEDVEPCLYYTYNAYMSSSSIFSASGSGMSATVKKKLMDSFQRGSVEILNISSPLSDSPTSPTLPPDLSVSSSKTKCFACALTRECDFRLRLAVTPGVSAGTEIHPICRFCRDRVTSVSDFFQFMNHLRQGLIGPGKQGATILGMFRHASWLRRRMAAGRVGSCSLFEADSLVAIDRRGDGEWEKLVHIIN